MLRVFDTRQKHIAKSQGNGDAEGEKQGCVYMNEKQECRDVR